MATLLKQRYGALAMALGEMVLDSQEESLSRVNSLPVSPLDHSQLFARPIGGSIGSSTRDLTVLTDNGHAHPVRSMYLFSVIYEERDITPLP
jgi:hypothetical protein